MTQDFYPQDVYNGKSMDTYVQEYVLQYHIGKETLETT